MRQRRGVTARARVWVEARLACGVGDGGAGRGGVRHLRGTSPSLRPSLGNGRLAEGRSGGRKYVHVEIDVLEPRQLGRGRYLVAPRGRPRPSCWVNFYICIGSFRCSESSRGWGGGACRSASLCTAHGLTFAWLAPYMVAPFRLPGYPPAPCSFTYKYAIGTEEGIILEVRLRLSAASPSAASPLTSPACWCYCLCARACVAA